MCRLAGYIGEKEAVGVIIDSLSRQSYGGYDSAGIVVGNEKNLTCVKSVGKLENLEKKLEKKKPKGNWGIGHIRWASHGKVSLANAHPFSDCQKKIYLVHNGIIENWGKLKRKLLKKGHRFTSETDSEILCHLIEDYFQGSLEEAVKKALREIRGTYGLLVISKEEPQKIVAARLSSPLLIGIGAREGEYILASDPTAIAPYTKKVINLNDYEIASVNPGDSLLIVKERRVQFLDFDVKKSEKGSYSHFMLKEIMEEPETIENAIRGRLVPEEGTVRLGGLEQVSEKLKKINRLLLVGCGTAFHAAKIGKYMIEEYANMPCEADVASELRYRKPFLDNKTAAVFISQSGETADTLAVLRELKKKGILTIGITNVVGSSQARETDAGVYTRSGPEISVASTKAFLGQLAVLAMLTVFLGRQRNMSLVTGKRIVSELSKTPRLVRKILKRAPEIKKLAKKYKWYQNIWFIGRKYNYPVALEGALKLKEISYLHAEGTAGGELKHGPLALIDKKFPTIAICPSDSVYDKMVSNIQEIKARQGKIIAIATEKNREIKEIADDVIFIPKTLEMLTPLLSVIPLQLLAYYVADFLDRDIDKPKNLAKSVTVE